jgi:hypothetical protein
MRELYYYSERVIIEENENNAEFARKADPAQYDRYTNRRRTSNEIIIEVPEEELEEVC